MTDPQESLSVIEHELHAQEQGLAQMEAQLQAEEEALLSAPPANDSKQSSLAAFADYVRDEESSLKKRAAALGVDAVARVDALLASAPSVAIREASVDVDTERMALIERRRGLYALRLELLEAREALLERFAELKAAESEAIAGLESALLERQRLVGDAARALFMGGTFPAPLGQGRSASELATEASGGPKAANEKPRSTVSQVKVTLNAALDGGGSCFVLDATDALAPPLLFLATPNLLKVGREVRVRIHRNGHQVEAAGVVRWVRERGQSPGQPGMGIALVDLADDATARIDGWHRDMPPRTLEQLA